MRAIVVSLDDDDLPGEATMQRIRAGQPLAYDHEELARRVEAEPEPVHCVLLRGRGPDGSGQFRMGRDLDDAQLVEVGHALARAQLDAWRDLLSRGLLAVARVELRVWELAALRSGTAQLLSELQAQSLDASPEEAEKIQAQRTLVEESLLNFGAGLDTVLTDLLPTRLTQLGAK